ncbi:hypothetical protein [Aquisediminimonas profunda]|nr:hypothetical protein [Aquisediminimonas profunda]
MPFHQFDLDLSFPEALDRIHPLHTVLDGLVAAHGSFGTQGVIMA